MRLELTPDVALWRLCRGAPQTDTGRAPKTSFTARVLHRARRRCAEHRTRRPARPNKLACADTAPAPARSLRAAPRSERRTSLPSARHFPAPGSSRTPTSRPRSRAQRGCLGCVHDRCSFGAHPTSARPFAAPTSASASAFAPANRPRATQGSARCSHCSSPVCQGPAMPARTQHRPSTMMTSTMATSGPHPQIPDCHSGRRGQEIRPLGRASRQSPLQLPTSAAVLPQASSVA